MCVSAQRGPDDSHDGSLRSGCRGNRITTERHQMHRNTHHTRYILPSFDLRNEKARSILFPSSLLTIRFLPKNHRKARENQKGIKQTQGMGKRKRTTTHFDPKLSLHPSSSSPLTAPLPLGSPPRSQGKQAWTKRRGNINRKKEEIE